MTLIREATIPSEFIKLDLNVTDADRPVNVRDERVKRENHNILAARRVRHPLVTQVFRGTDWSTDGQTFKHCAYAVNFTNKLTETISMGGAPELARWRVRVPSYCSYLTFRFRAKMSTADGDGYLYPYVGTTPKIDYMITVTGTSYAEYEMDVPASDGTREATDTDAGVNFTCEAYNSPQEEAVTVVDASNVSTYPPRAWVMGDAAVGGVVGDMLYFSDPANTIQPRTITLIENVTVDGSTYERVWVDRPWDIMPEIGDTYYTSAVAGLIVHSVAIVPKAITDFWEGSGVV